MKSISKLAYALCIAMCLSVCVCAQNYSINGIVKDLKTGKVLKGASIKIHGTTIGCVTDSNGKFSLENLKSDDIIIKASYAGYATERSFLRINKNIINFIFALEKSLINLDEVVVTGTGSHYKLKNSPVQTELISRKTIENIGATSMEGLLETISPSFDFSPSSGMGTFAHMNGLGSKYITFMIDGKKISGDISGNVDLSRINTANIEKVEIVKGAASSLYGSDAIGGVVNIITKKNNNKLKISSNSQIGENGRFTENANFAIKLGKLNSVTNYNFKENSSYTLNQGRNEEYFVYGNNSKNINQQFDIKLNESLKIKIGGDYFSKKTFTSRNKPKASAYDYYYDGLTLDASAKYILNKKNYIELSVNNNMFNQEKFFYKDYVYKNKLKNKAGEYEFNKKQTTTTANLKGVFKIGRKNTIVGGIEFINDKLESDTKLKSGKETSYTSSLYAQDVFKPIENLSFVLGARGVKHETFGSEFTPKISSMYKLGNFNLRATYSQGFKTPTLQELFYQYEKGSTLTLGNTELNPEKSKYYNFSIEYVESWLNASISIYRNNINNMINKIILNADSPLIPAESNASKFYLYSNIEKARTQGIDIAFNSYIGYGFTLSGGYSYVDAKDLADDSRLERVAQNYANTKIAWDKEFNNYSMNFTLTGKYQDGKMYKDFKTKEYNTWRLSTNHRFITKKNFNINLMGGVDNIFDYRDDSPVAIAGRNSTIFYYGTLTPGRTFFFGIKIEFTK